MLGLPVDNSVFGLQLLLWRIGIITIFGSFVLSFVIVVGVYRNNIKDYTKFLKGVKDAALCANIFVLPFYVIREIYFFVEHLFKRAIP
jgi:hypothetical protein